jgi:hypothetical protein
LSRSQGARPQRDGSAATTEAGCLDDIALVAHPERDIKPDLSPLKPRDSHIWRPAEDGFYVEEPWVAERLFDVERFDGAIHDPCTGFGTIPHAAIKAGLRATAADIVDRSSISPFGKIPRFAIREFLTDDRRWPNTVFNPPFHIVRQFILRALAVTERKVAAVFPLARLPAARWISDTPLRDIWLLTPRPSMPPGHVIAAGEKPQGGRVDFCWLVWDRGYDGPPELRWLHRDGPYRPG